MDAQNVPKPDLTYPFDSLVHPAVHEVEDLEYAWLNEGYERTMADTLARFRTRETLCTRFAARMFPLGTRNAFVSETRFLVWGLINDDFFEDHNADEMQVHKQRSVGILSGAEQPRDDDIEIYRQLGVLHDECITQMPQQWVNRFAHSVGRYLDGMIMEVPFKRHMRFPTIDEYTVIRRSAVCVYPLFVLLELDMGVALPEETVRSAPFFRLADLTCQILAWANDYYSIRKESGKDVMNIVLVCQREMNLDLEAAYRAAVSIHDRDVNEVIDICNALPRTPTIQHFAHRLKLLLAGQRDWYHYDTRRYPLVMER